MSTSEDIRRPFITARLFGWTWPAATSFLFLKISEQTRLFGFKESGFDPSAIAFSEVAEGATVVLLGAFLVARFAARIPMPRW
jgi:hypothetical protein